MHARSIKSSTLFYSFSSHDTTGTRPFRIGNSRWDMKGTKRSQNIQIAAFIKCNVLEYGYVLCDQRRETEWEKSTEWVKRQRREWVRERQRGTLCVVNDTLVAVIDTVSDHTNERLSRELATQRFRIHVCIEWNIVYPNTNTQFTCETFVQRSEAQTRSHRVEKNGRKDKRTSFTYTQTDTDRHRHTVSVLTPPMRR